MVSHSRNSRPSNDLHLHTSGNPALDANLLSYIGQVATVTWLASFLVISITTVRLGQPQLGLRYVAGLVVVLQFNKILRLLRTSLTSSAYLYAFVSICAEASLSGALSLSQRSSQYINTSDASELEFMRPMFLPCRTTHTRLFPTKHSFSYSYLFVGVPVSWTGSAGSILSIERNYVSKTWFTVAAEDYLLRGFQAWGLLDKVKEYLLSQGEQFSSYPYVYLVTAPRFMGFSFNPVSFWYLYNSSRTLTAMILEVNNTFDERRMYFMKSNSPSRFSSEWEKDFHVSPFNDRQGSYSVSVTNPWTHPEKVSIDNNIVLRSVEGKPKIVARVFSTQTGLDAYAITPWQTAWFIARWWWVGFMTNPRILREAWALWFKQLKVFYRPEVLKSSIGRTETKAEMRIEPHFRVLLERISEMCELEILYTPAAGVQLGKTIIITPTTTTSDVGKRSMYNNTTIINPNNAIHIRILTPELYSSLLRCEDLMTCFDEMCFNQDGTGVMLDVSAFAVLRDAMLNLAPLQTSNSEMPKPPVDWMLELCIGRLKPSITSTVAPCLGTRNKKLEQTL